MLRFNIRRSRKKITQIHISIHPMLRFNIGSPSKEPTNTSFQYILCYGSTHLSSQNSQRRN